jgi:hypothetical protein
LFREEECVKKILTLALSHFVGEGINKKSSEQAVRSEEQRAAASIPASAGITGEERLAGDDLETREF